MDKIGLRGKKKLKVIMIAANDSILNSIGNLLKKRKKLLLKRKFKVIVL